MAHAFDLIEVHGSSGSDALIEEIIFTAPDARIVIGLWLEKADCGAQSIAASKGLRAGGRRCICGCWPTHREPHAAGYRGLKIDSIGDHFEAGDAKIDALRWALLGDSGGRFVEILFDFETHGASIGNRAFDGAQQTVR